MDKMVKKEIKSAFRSLNKLLSLFFFLHICYFRQKVI